MGRSILSAILCDRARKTINSSNLQIQIYRFTEQIEYVRLPVDLYISFQYFILLSDITILCMY